LRHFTSNLKIFRFKFWSRFSWVKIKSKTDFLSIEKFKQYVSMWVQNKVFFYRNDKLVFFVFNNKIKLLDRDMMCRLPDLIHSLVFFFFFNIISKVILQRKHPNGIIVYVISRLLWSYSIVTLQKNTIWRKKNGYCCYFC
jgi:hypothetical protein